MLVLDLLLLLLLPLLKLSRAESIKEEDPRIVNGQVGLSAKHFPYRLLTDSSCKWSHDLKCKQ